MVYEFGWPYIGRMTDSYTDKFPDLKFPTTKPVANQFELAILAEESGEIVQIVGKVLRFGYESTNPYDASPTPVSNLDLLHEEVGDVQAAAEFAVERGLLNKKKLAERKKWKLAKLRAKAPPVYNPETASIETVYLKHESTKNDYIGALIILALILILPAISWFVSRAFDVPNGPPAAVSTVDSKLAAAELAKQCYETSIDTDACKGYAELAGRPDLIPAPIKK